MCGYMSPAYGDGPSVFRIIADHTSTRCRTTPLPLIPASAHMDRRHADHEKLGLCAAHVLPVVAEVTRETKAVAGLQEIYLVSDGEFHLPLDAELELLTLMMKISLLHAGAFGDGQQDCAEGLIGHPVGQRLDPDLEIRHGDGSPLLPREEDHIPRLHLFVQERLKGRP